jgi:ribose transport system ATP-binding protein
MGDRAAGAVAHHPPAQPEPSRSSSPMLRVETISKEFPGVKALSDVSLAFAPGEIHAVVGENGAGKSTLIKIVCGIYQPDGGTLSLDDTPLSLHAYSDAMALGIQLVSQEIQVIPKMTIAENILLHRIDRFRHRGLIDWGSIATEAAVYTRLVGLDLPVLTPAGGLSAAQKQLVMIAKALSSDAKVLILDEPTSSLTLHEANNLFGVLRGLRERGVAIIFVSHKLEEVLDIADRVSVLRDGRFVGSHPTSELTKDAIVTMMLGRSAVTEPLGTLDIDYDTIVLEARGITAPDMFDGLDFKLHAGEILGFYGLVGSGRTELAQILIGEDRAFSGEVLIRGEAARISGMADALSRYRLGYVSENRKEKGLILRASINTNIAITVWDRISRPLAGISLTKEREIGRRYMDAVEVRATGPEQVVGSLSGGNQQKVSIAKWLAAGCDTLIVDEPTIGVDIGAKEAIHQLIWDLAKKEGKSIILISSDLPEMVHLARRILVFRKFHVVGEITELNERPRTYDDVSIEIGRYLA